MKIFIIICAVLVFYFMPSFYSTEYTELCNLRENSFRSLVMIIIMACVCRERPVVIIMLIESFLIAVNFAVSLSFSGGGFFGQHYEKIQLYAFIAELIILGDWGLREVKIGIFNSYADRRNANILDRRNMGVRR